MKTLLPLFIVMFCYAHGLCTERLDKTEPYVLSESVNFDSLIIKHDYFVQVNMDSALYYLNMAEQSKEDSIHYQRIVYLLKYCQFTFMKDNIDSIELKNITNYAHLGLNLAQEENQLYYQLKFNKVLANLFAEMQKEMPIGELGPHDYNMAAYNIAKRIGNKEELSMILFNIIITEQSYSNIEYLNQYISELRQNVESPMSKIRYFFLVSDLQRDNVDMQINYLDSALSIASESNLSLAYNNILALIADKYVYYQCYEEALFYLNKLDSIYLHTPKEFSMKDLLFLSKSKFYYNLGDFKKAKTIFDENNLREKIKYKYEPVRYAYNLHKSLGDTLSAFTYLEDLNKFIYERRKVFRDSVYQASRAAFELDKRETELKLKDVRIQVNQSEHKKQIITILSIFLIILLLLYIAYMKYKRKVALERANADHERNMLQFQNRLIESVTHEINTPLTVIHGVLEEIQRTGNINQDFLNLGLSNVKQLAIDVERIWYTLNDKKIEQNDIFECPCLLTFFQDIIENYKVNAWCKGINIVFEHNICKDNVTHFDINKVEIILSNYLSNAIKFSNEGDVIEVKVMVTNNELLFWVKDYGYKLNKEDIPYIFSKGYTKKSPMNRWGHGIGLHLCKELAGFIKAQLSVEVNDIEKSTIFSFKMNLSIEQVNEAFFTHIYRFDTNLDIKDNRLNQSKVLLVDDNEMMIEFYKKVLSNRYLCSQALNGEVALNMIREHHYDCIILDYAMPKMNGLELVLTMRKERKGEDLPIIFVTANFSEELKLEAFNVGIHDFMTKPFMLSEFLARISNVITNYERYKLINSNVVTKELNTFNTVEEIPENTKFIQNVIKYIKENMGEQTFSIENLASQFFYTQRHFGRKVKEMTGLTTRELILEIRLKRAYKLLKNDASVRIGEVQHIVGIKSTTYFNKVYKTRFGITPSQTRKKE